MSHLKGPLMACDIDPVVDAIVDTFFPNGLRSATAEAEAAGVCGVVPPGGLSEETPIVFADLALGFHLTS